MQWLLGNLDALDARAEPVAWMVQTRSDAADALAASVRATRADLADAALAREDAGGGRLFRRLMLRALAARIFGGSPRSVEVKRSASGGILLPGLPAYASVSGSGDYHLVAVGRRPIGADIESGDGADALLEWTAKEAYLKALGIGFGAPQQEVMLDPCGEGFIARIGGLGCGHVRLFGGRGFTAALAERTSAGDSG